MNSRRNSNADKKGGFKLLDIAHGTVPATPPEIEDNSEEGREDVKPNEEERAQISTENEDTKAIFESENFEENKVKATKEDCLKLLKESFDGYDYNGNGTVAHEEVREAWMMCQEEWNQASDFERCNLEAAIFMKDIDIGGDNQVDFEEYVKYFRHLWLLSQGYEI